MPNCLPSPYPQAAWPQLPTKVTPRWAAGAQSPPFLQLKPIVPPCHPPPHSSCHHSGDLHREGHIHTCLSLVSTQLGYAVGCAWPVPTTWAPAVTFKPSLTDTGHGWVSHCETALPCSSASSCLQPCSEFQDQGLFSQILPSLTHLPLIFP